MSGMGIEDNKRTVRRFFEHLSRGETKAVLDLYADDASVWTAGSLAFSGRRSKQEVAPLMEGILGAFPEGLRFTIHGITAEGDRVAVEAESQGRHANGKLYNNLYHFLLVVREAKVREFKEYLDTKLAHEVLLDGA
jgi:ketosteroid isomerase-like protein